MFSLISKHLKFSNSKFINSFSNSYKISYKLQSKRIISKLHNMSLEAAPEIHLKNLGHNFAYAIINDDDFD